ncbi:MAG: peptidylprolyl isomerase [Oscillospiraceae bacterium]|nr:peptidylprolyl isomerase [Oscillospiraceae bacterium]
MRTLRTVFCLLLTALLLLSCTACGQSAAPTTTTASDAPEDVPDAEPAKGETEAQPEGIHGLHHVELEIRDYGTVILELDADTAPITVQNFLDLAGSGFYDGLTFHRIMDGFMIQGGDPLGNGTGGSGTNIKGEFALNGWENGISHQKGVVSMARARPYDSASSQFFICVGDASFLDGQYAAFGWVTEGMEIVEQIARDARPVDNNGTIPAAEQPVIERVTVLD